MTFRSKLMLALVTVLVLSLAPSSFAQVNILLNSTGSPGEIQTNRNAQTAQPGVPGDGILVTGQLVAASPLTTTLLTFTYPAPITSGPVLVANGTPDPVPTADPIRLEGQTGLFATITAVYTVNYTAGTVSVQLPGTGANAQSGSFRIVGVRLDANGKSGAQTATASLNSSANNYLPPNPSTVPVINSIANGIGSFAVGSRSGQTSNGTATIFTNRNLVDSAGSLVLTEGFASAFRSQTQLSNSGVAVPNSTDIRLTFSNVPSGVTLTLTLNPPAGMTAIFTGSNVITSTNTTATIRFTSTSLTTTESLQVDVIVSQTGTSSVGTAGSITVVATFVPIGDALDSADNTPTEAGGYPRFAQLDVGPVTIVNIVPASTTMLIPFAAKIGAFDTSLAIANTTADPFGASGGGATPAAGTLIFDFFPTDETGTGGALPTFRVTTGPTVRPGVPSALSSDGTLAAGATWTAQLSQVMALASPPVTGDFIGYVFITANFLNAHGTATITDFRTFSLSANVLVMPPPSTASRNAPAHNNFANGVETMAY